MRSVRSIPITFLLVAVPGFWSAQAQSVWETSAKLRVGGEGGWDYVTVDAQSHRLFITRTTHNLVLDAVPALNRGFITDGGG